MRPARAVIDLAAFRHNYRLARDLSGCKALAVVKADAYGHGAVQCAKALEGEADGFAVACAEEALELRDSGIRSPILLLAGFFDAGELSLIDEHNLWFAVEADWQIDAIERFQAARPLSIWLNLDSGMHRLGLSAKRWNEARARLASLKQVREVIGMTHFARADELGSQRTREQLANYLEASDIETGDAPALTRSLSNSAAVLGWPEVRGDWVRPGLMLYGANPFGTAHPQADRLRAVMTLESTIFSVRDLAVGEPVGYGGTFVARRPTRVGVVALGYADGYPQFAPNGTPVTIDGHRAELIGRVSMDMLTVDLTDHPQADRGSRVELWGKQIPVTEVAARCHASAYSLLCGVKRVQRNWSDS